MGKNEFCVLFEHYFLLGKTFSETKVKLDKYYSDPASSYEMVQKWFTEFRCVRTSTETIPSPGRLNETTTPEMINKIRDIVLNDPKVKVRELDALRCEYPFNGARGYRGSGCLGCVGQSQLTWLLHWPSYQ